MLKCADKRLLAQVGRVVRVAYETVGERAQLARVRPDQPLERAMVASSRRAHVRVLVVGALRRALARRYLRPHPSAADRTRQVGRQGADGSPAPADVEPACADEQPWRPLPARGGILGPEMRFGYYKRLTAEQKATYRKSDEVTAVAVPEAAALVPLVEALEVALGSGKRLATAKAASAFALAFCQQLGVPAVRITVRLVRPEIRGGELHGLYTFSGEGKAPAIEVWMKTAAQRRIVKFRTFLRTLVHEMMHHLDVALFRLDDSFHTQGFYARESSVMRQLLPPPRPSRAAKVVRAPPKQLDLFDAK